MAKLSRQLVSCPWWTGVKLCKKVDRTSMMKSREYDDTKQSGCLSRKNRKNTVLKLGRQHISCPWRTRVKHCKKVEHMSMMKSIICQWWRRSYVNDEDGKKQWSIKEKQKLYLFQSSNICVALGSNLCWGWQKKSPSYLPLQKPVKRDQKPVKREAGFFFLAGYENRLMYPDTA